MVPLLAGGMYLLVLLGYSLYSMYAFHHLNEYGYSVETTQYMFRVYLISSAIIVVITVGLLVLGLAWR